jgi:hypothetical protein
LIGSVVPGIGTVIGAGLGAWIGHLNDESRSRRKFQRQRFQQHG